MQLLIDDEVEKSYSINQLEKRVLEKWEIVTNREEMGHGVIEEYKVGFEKTLTNFNLNKPENWHVAEKNGVQIISFSGDDQLPTLNDLDNRKINNIITAKKNFDFDFITDDKCQILRRIESNFGYVTGASDAEYILSTL